MWGALLVWVLYHGDFRLHDPAPYDHPESPYRVDVALHGLIEYGVMEFARLKEPPKADISTVYSSVHDPAYVERVLRSIPQTGPEWLDADTYVSPGTRRSLERLAGSVVEAVNLALEGKGPVVVLGRPPGHHAGARGRALGAPTLGFCLLNTAAALAQRVIDSRGGTARVAMLDFDLHHGNGTQEIFYERGDVLHVDIHQDSRTIYPGTGHPWQVGGGRGRGSKVNINVPPGARDDIMLQALNLAMSYIEAWSPEYVIVSAGFDSYRDDNYMGLIGSGSRYFHEAGSRLRRLGIPVIVFLEGGYGAGLERGLPALLHGLAGRPDPVKDEVEESPKHVWSEFEKLTEALKRELAWTPGG